MKIYFKIHYTPIPPDIQPARCDGAVCIRREKHSPGKQQPARQNAGFTKACGRNARMRSYFSR
jgi:hypothetical protein